MLLSEDRKPIVATNSVFTEDLTEVHIDGKTLRELYEVKDEGIVVADKHFVFFVDLHSRYNSKITIIGVPEYFEKL